MAARPLLPPLDLTRPVIPTVARIATSPLGQEAEAAYLAYLHVLGETLLSLDPGPLTAVMTGEALAAQTAELNARAAVDLPAQLVARRPALAFFHAPDGSPTV
ncbi:MAG: hypothetical protein M3442_10470, partial [Chloroflexota bacterium]|nr:hypothetical protein [Chloroflexota bacterium]